MVVAAAVLLAQTAVLVANIAYWRRKRATHAARLPSVSVLIPARDEIANLPELLAALESQQHPPFEVLICDDGSTDGTDAWLAEHAHEYGATWFRGPAKPEGWVGKCWACHQLGLRARGDWLLFLDADVRPAPTFLAMIAQAMAGTEAILVTALPRFDPTTVGDGMLTAMVPFSVFTLLPLSRAERDRRPAFAFANGQVMGFRRDDYAAHRPHEQVREYILEDVAIARWAKRAGARVLILDATRTLSVRMYRGAGEAMRGFSRNASLICGGNVGSALVVALLATTYVLPWALAFGGWIQAWALAASGAFLYGYCAIRFGFGARYALLTPVAVLFVIATIARSAVWQARGAVRWKGRVYGR